MSEDISSENSVPVVNKEDDPKNSPIALGLSSSPEKKALEDDREELRESILDADSLAKNRYVSSSSDSSSENEKHVETAIILETSESSYQVETNNSEDDDDDDDISLASSTDLQGSPPPRYFSSKARKDQYISHHFKLCSFSLFTNFAFIMQVTLSLQYFLLH